MSERKADIEAFLGAHNLRGSHRTQVAGDASQRRYHRLVPEKGDSLILMDAPPDESAALRAFVTIALHLRSIGLSAPKVLVQDEAQGFLVLEDFGDALFADLMARDPAQERPLYSAAADVLHRLIEARPLTLRKCDTKWLVDAVAPLFEWYAKDTGQSTRSDFAELFIPFANRVSKQSNVMILRDYHAQNLLLLPDRQGVGQVGILDFQDAMIGHPAYDLVSILQDARRDVPDTIEAEMLTGFIAKGCFDEVPFREAYAILGLQRNLRILGIFARLCLRDGKPHYVDFIPRVWGYVRKNLSHPALANIDGFLTSRLPEPTPEFLGSLKAQCPTPSRP